LVMVTSSLAVLLKIAPPTLFAELPEMVLLLMVTVPPSL